MIFNSGVSGGIKAKLDFSFDGTMSAVRKDEEGNWEFDILSSGGAFVFNKNPGLIDVCLVGGGGYGGGLGGAGGGYVVTVLGVQVSEKIAYQIIIGDGAVSGDERGGTTTAFGYTARGGYSSVTDDGGNGGNGGGAGAWGSFGGNGGDGGSYGGDGSGGVAWNSDQSIEGYSSGGKGQGAGTTRAFSEPNGIPLAGGGAGRGRTNNGAAGDGGGGNVDEDAIVNTGGGGGSGGEGACGIVIVRNHREVS